MTTVLDAIKESLKKLNKEVIKRKKEKLNNNTRVILGRSPSFSSFFESTLAKELSKVYPNFYFYVDFPIRILNEENKSIKNGGQSIYPDIMIVDKENKLLKAIIEIKLDIGYVNLDREENSKRDNDFEKANKIRFNKLVGAYSREEKEENEEIMLSISPKIKKIAIIVTKKNSHGREKGFEKILKKRGYTSIFLLEKIHFNTMGDISKKIEEEVDEKKDTILNAFNRFD